MPGYKSYSSRAPKSNARSSSKARIPAVSISRSLDRRIADIAHRVVLRTSETKHAFNYYNPTAFNATISGTGDCANILPDITQATGSSNRIGERIIPTSLDIKGYVLPYYLSTQPLYQIDVEVFLLMDKDQRDGAGRDADSAKFIRQGANTVNYDGTLQTSCAPVDLDRFKVLKRMRFRVLPVPQNSYQTYQNSNSGSVCHDWHAKIDMTKIAPHLDYDTSGSTQPNNVNMYLCCGYVHYYDPATAVTTLATPVTVSFATTLSYKDL